jgi:fatty acid desaturase
VHPNCTREELAHIEDGLPEASERIPWRILLGVCQTWAIITAKFLVDPIWWFYPPFFIAGMACLTALLVIHVLSPKLKPVSAFTSSELIGM